VVTESDLVKRLATVGVEVPPGILNGRD
jgi:hypothetical protein